jgi:toxin ParE1/3/4
MTRKLRYHSLAQRDFVRAADWSHKQWGTERTRRYLKLIEAEVQRILENPLIAPEADLPRPGIRKATAGRHTIFYTIAGDEVLIVRILGQQQDHQSAAGLD